MSVGEQIGQLVPFHTNPPSNAHVGAYSERARYSIGAERNLLDFHSGRFVFTDRSEIIERRSTVMFQLDELLLQFVEIHLEGEKKPVTRKSRCDVKATFEQRVISPISE